MHPPARAKAAKGYDAGQLGARGARVLFSRREVENHVGLHEGVARSVHSDQFVIGMRGNLEQGDLSARQSPPSFASCKINKGRRTSGSKPNVPTGSLGTTRPVHVIRSLSLRR